MLDTLLQVFVLVGITILITLQVIRLQSNRLIENLNNLSQANKLFEFDVLTLTEKSWPFFQKACFIGFHYHIVWFGSHIEGNFGQPKGHYLQFNEQLDDLITVHIKAFRGKTKGEKKHFQQIFWQTFIQLLKMDLLIKANSIYQTEKQLQKYNTFLLHDIKNIAQFIVVLNTQINSINQHNQQEVIALLQNILPEILIRSERIIQTLTEKEINIKSTDLPPDQLQSVDKRIVLNLSEQVQQIADFHNVTISLHGSKTSLLVDKGILDQVLDNIIGNYQQHTQSLEPIKVTIIASNNSVRLCLNSPVKVSKEQYIHLFEPFWSSSDHGMGIGMYQCKTLLESIHASIHVRQLEDHSLEFIIDFPSTS